MREITGWAAFQQLDEDRSPTMLTCVRSARMQVILDAFYAAFPRSEEDMDLYAEVSNALNTTGVCDTGHGWRIWIARVSVREVGAR